MRKIDVKKLEKYTPPGVSFASRLKHNLWHLAVAVGWSCSYLIKYITARNNLFEYSLVGKVLREGALMPGFGDLIYEGMVLELP